MVAKKPGGSPSSNGHQLIEFGPTDSPEMLELTALTKPGPFGTRTHELGTYVGLREEGKLVAMAGERLKMPDIPRSAQCVRILSITAKVTPGC